MAEKHPTSCPPSKGDSVGFWSSQLLTLGSLRCPWPPVYLASAGWVSPCVCADRGGICTDSQGSSPHFPSPAHQRPWRLCFQPQGGAAASLKRSPHQSCCNTGCGGKTLRCGFSFLIFFCLCENYSDTDPKGFAQNRACSNLLISQMRKGSPESAGTQPPKEQRRLAGHPPSKLPQVMQPRTHPGSRARRGPLTAQKTQEGSGTTAPLCAVHNCPGDLRPQPLYVCAVENCPGDLRDPSPTVCSGELPRRPQEPQPHCVQWRTAQETSGTPAPLCAVENCPGDLRDSSPTMCSELPRRPQGP